MSLQQGLMGATLALAAVGGYFFGPVGFSAGMMIGSWISSAFAEEDNVIIDPGAEELPRFNNALRGVTMPVMFGTNRVSSNLVWQNNFQVIRHESKETSGGGKGGGSGGGKGGGGPTNVTYEYKWDLMYHFGMVSEDFNLFGGWLYAQRMNDDTLVAISQGGSFGANIFFKSEIDRPQTAELTFEESFFHPGYATGDTLADNWDYFDTVVGSPHRFPHTAYIGFKGLDLGESPHVPQLSFEIGPGNADLNFDGGFIGNADPGVSGGCLGQRMMAGDDGNNYYFVSTGTTSLGSLHRIEDGAMTDFITSTEYDDMWHDYTGLDPARAFQFTNGEGGAVVGDYVLLWGWDAGGGSSSTWSALLCKVDTSGLLYAVGDFANRSATIASLVHQVLRVGILGNETKAKPICLMFINSVSASRDIKSVAVASIDQMIAGASDLITAGTFDGRVTNHTATLFDYMGIHQSYRQFGAFGWFAAYVDEQETQSAFGVIQYGTKFQMYISKSDIQKHIDDPAAGDANALIASYTGTYPNGLIIEIDLGIDNDVPSQTGNLREINSNFTLAKNNVALVPFADAMENLDGTEDLNDDYSPAPMMERVKSGEAEGAYILLFTKQFTGSEDLGDSGSYNKTRMFLYNPLSQRYREYGTGEGELFDTVSDIGASEGDRYAYECVNQIVLLNQSTKTAYELRTLNGGLVTELDDQVIVSQWGTYDLGGGEDVLPPFIIHEILTSPVFGIGRNEADINSESYTLALQYCDAEDIRVSTTYMREEGALRIIEMLLALYGGYLTDSGGEISFGIQDLSNNVVRTIDNHHLVIEDGEAPVTVTLSAKQESYNKIKINYIDRNLEYRQNFVELNDEVDQDLNGIRAREFPGKFVMKEPLAVKLAERTLWSNLYGKDRFSFKLGPKDADLKPGDVITLVDSFSPNTELNAGVRCRIATWEETKPLQFSVTGVKEIEYINTSTQQVTSATAATFNQLYGPVRAPADFRMYELPKEFQGSDPTLFVGWNQLSPAMGAQLYLSADGVSFAKADDISPYIISGIFAAALPDRSGLFVEENVKLYLMPDTRSTDVQTGFNPASPTYVQTHALDDVDAPGRGLGAGNIYAGSEMLAFEGLNLIGQNEYRVDKLYRGWGGTNIQAHNSGAYWHKHAGGVFTRPYNEDKIGTLIHYKVVPYNFGNVVFNVSSVDAKTYAIDGMYFKPQVQPPIRTFVTSGITVPASENLGALEFKHVHSTGTNVDFVWPDAARDKGYGTAGYGSGLYGRFTIDTTSHNYRVEVYSNDLSTVVRCLTVDTGFFTYSRDINSTDFNGWSGDTFIRVTPFNDIGDAPRDQTKRIQLFEQV